MINKHMKWKDHTEMIGKKISKSGCKLNRLKNFLPQDTLKLIYSSLINSHLNYGILCWGSNANAVEILQKKAIRALTISKYNAHTQPLLKKKCVY